MSTPASRPEPVCRYLRTKRMYIDVEPDPLVPDGGDGSPWCVHTQTCLGPDGKVVEAASCRSGRGCFES